MFTRDELFELFSDRYTQTQIIAALYKLAEFDTSVHPEASEFSSEVSIKLEEVFKIIQDAITQQKQLTGDTLQADKGGTIQQVGQFAIDIATDRAIDIPVEILPAIAEIIAGEEIARAAAITQMRDTIFRQALSDLDTKRLSDFGQQSSENIQLMLKLFNDPEKVKQLLDDYGIQPVHKTEENLQTFTNTCSVDFDPDAFLTEVAMGKKKGEDTTPPRTIADTKAMVKSLVNRTLQSSKGLSSPSL